MKKETLIKILENLDINDISYFKIVYTSLFKYDDQVLEYDK